MKKGILISLGVVVALLIAILIGAEVFAFNLVKKTTDQINLDLNHKFEQIVRIPSVVPPSYRSFTQTTYSWEMETPQKEIIRVNFTHDTGFSKSQKTITATLSMPTGGDASLFNKVLPAVVSDSQALSSAQDYQHENLGANDEIGYEKITLERVKDDNTKVTKITWEFQKNKLTKDEPNLYSKLYKYPEPLLKILYAIQSITISAFSGSG